MLRHACTRADGGRSAQVAAAGLWSQVAGYPHIDILHDQFPPSLCAHQLEEDEPLGDDLLLQLVAAVHAQQLLDLCGAHQFDQLDHTRGTGSGSHITAGISAKMHSDLKAVLILAQGTGTVFGVHIERAANQLNRIAPSRQMANGPRTHRQR